MSVADIYEKRATVSFEVFPPKTDVGMEKLCGKDGVLDKLYTLEPDYISCTYGAGGTNVGKNLEVLDKIQKDGKTIPVTHFTCIGNTKEDIKEKLQTYLDHGIDHMLALRGDLPFGWTGTNGDLHYATELVKFVRKEFGDKFTIAVAGSPEGHIQCRSLEADIAFLKQKQDNGADFIISQLCWDMDAFRYWLEAIRNAGVWLPVDAGIMPITTITGTLTNALSRNACVMDRRLCEIISKNRIFPNPFAPNESEESIAAKKASFKEAGIAHPYSYVYDGQIGRLDHALLSPALAARLQGAAEWHINADEPDAPGLAEAATAVRGVGLAEAWDAAAVTRLLAEADLLWHSREEWITLGTG